MDEFVIYFSAADDGWIAHGLRTDQIGFGESPFRALVDGLKAVRQVMTLAKRDRTVNPFRPAPASVRRRVAKARPFPRELAEVAHKLATGDWPADLHADLQSSRRTALRVELLTSEK